MKKQISVYKYLLAFIAVYFSCNSFVLAIKYGSNANLIMTVVTLVAFVVALWKGKNKVPQQTIVLMIAGIYNLLLTSLGTGYTNAYLLLVFNFLLAYAFIRLYTRQEFYECYISIMKLLSICAIVAGIINIIIPQLFSSVKIYVTGAGSHNNYYYDLLLAFQAVKNIRINSIWGEPGMFAVFLIFALILESFFVKRKIKLANYIIFVVGIILTFSTTGYICLILTVATLLLNNNQSHKRKGMLTWTLSLLIIGMIILERVPWFQEQLVSMLGKLEEEDISFIGRAAPAFYNLKEGLRSPLWGHGLRGGKFYVEFLWFRGYLTCNTSTTTFLFASFGIILSGITVWLMGKFANQDKTLPYLVRILLFVIVIVNINTQAVHLDQIYWLLLFSVFMDPSKLQSIQEEI